jgi:hypothetical protein
VYKCCAIPTMSRYERKDTVVCAFERERERERQTERQRDTEQKPRITVFEIHEWIHRQLQLYAEDVETIQIHGTNKQVFIKTAQAQ